MRWLLPLAVATLGLGLWLPAGSADATSPNACWGQATKAFAKMGEMGEHASEQDEPRLGLRNLARELFDAGILPDDSIQSLGAFVAAELGLAIDACNAAPAIGPQMRPTPPAGPHGPGAASLGLGAAAAPGRER